MKVWLIHVTEGGKEKVHKNDTEHDALQYIGHVIVGNRIGTEIKSIYRADCAEGKLVEMETTLEGATLKLIEKES